MKPGLSGYTIVRNAVDLDYCVELAIRSMSPVCSEIVVCDSDSTDGTMELLEKMAQEPEFKGRLRIVNFPWTNPVGQVTWLTSWMNHTREFLEYDTQLYLDADEVLSPSACSILSHNVGNGKCFWFERLNFWRTARTLAPHGFWCSHLVSRFGPANLWMPSDEMYIPGQHPGTEPEIRTRSEHHPMLKIFHYGALRKKEQFFAKSKVAQTALIGGYDPRLLSAEKSERPWEDFAPFIDGNGHEIPMLKFKGKHPRLAEKWLKERNRLT